MEFIVEIILQFLAELFMQIVIQILAELGFHSIAEITKRPLTTNPILSYIGYGLFGAIFGGLSLLIFPNSFIHLDSLRWANLLITPLIAGLFMMWIGMIRMNYEQIIIRMNHFSYGFLFAFSMTIVRHIWAIH